MKRLILLVTALFLIGTLQAQNYEEILSKMNQAKALADAKQYVAAGDAYRAVSRMVKNSKTETDRQVYVVSLIKASSNYYMSKDSCEVGYKIAKSLLQDKLTDDERQLAERYYSLNGASLSMRCIKSDRKQYEKGRAVAEEVLPYATPKVKTSLLKTIATSWYLEAYDYEFAGEYDRSYSCFEHAGEEYNKIGEVEDYVGCLTQMALCRYWQHKYQDALGLYEQAYTYSEQYGLSAQQIDILTGKKKIYKAIDDRSRLAETIVAINSLIGSSEQMDASMYMLLGDDAVDLGDYYLAETYYLKALESIGTDSKQSDIPILYSRLRAAMKKAKDYSKALTYENKRVDAERTVSGHVFGEFEQPALIYAEMNDRDSALFYADKYLMSMENQPVRDRATAYTMCSLIYGKMGEYATAIDLLDKADRSIVKEFGNEDAQRMDLIALKAGYRSRVEQYSESLKGYRQYYQWVTSVYGDESVEACNALYYIANSEALCGNVEEGERLYIEFIDKYLPIVQYNLRSVSSSEREHYWQSLSEALLQMAAFGIKNGANHDRFTEAGYNALLFSKSLLLASEQSMFDILQKKGTQNDLIDYATIASLQAQINELSRDYTENRTLISELNSEKLTIDRSLTERCKAYDDYTSFLNLRYKDIKQALKSGEVVVDFTDYINANGEHEHAAYVIRRSDKHPLLLRVFSGEQIDSLLVGLSPEYLYSNEVAGRALDVLWRPLSPYIEEGSTVYYVPSGMVHQIAIESIPISNDSILGDRYNFFRLSSAREIISHNNSENISDVADATLLGGLIYEVDGNTMTAESNKYDIPPTLRTRSINRDRLNDEPFSYLSYSREEVIDVADILRKNNIKVTTLIGSQGTEEAFLSLSGNAPTVLLMSTHGFYYTKDEAQSIDVLKDYSDAMSLTGLIMAGANKAWRGEALPEGVQSGILTAAKIARVDLEGNQLAVLSACHTAEGKATSEGVYGLQRAFKKAGTETIIMTLWSVNDLSTKEFITTFFHRLTDNGWDKYEAFEYAKRALRSRYKDPLIWAPYVMLDGIN